MSNGNSANRRKRAGILLLALVSLAGVGSTAPAREFVSSAHQFATYYRALERASLRTNFWDRVALSLVLASDECASARCGKPTSSSPPCAPGPS